MGSGRAVAASPAPLSSVVYRMAVSKGESATEHFTSALDKANHADAAFSQGKPHLASVDCSA